jgi:hypothetical protein
MLNYFQHALTIAFCCFLCSARRTCKKTSIFVGAVSSITLRCRVVHRSSQRCRPCHPFHCPPLRSAAAADTGNPLPSQCSGYYHSAAADKGGVCKFYGSDVPVFAVLPRPSLRSAIAATVPPFHTQPPPPTQGSLCHPSAAAAITALSLTKGGGASFMVALSLPLQRCLSHPCTVPLLLLSPPPSQHCRSCLHSATKPGQPTKPSKANSSQIDHDNQLSL